MRPPGPPRKPRPKPSQKIEAKRARRKVRRSRESAHEREEAKVVTYLVMMNGRTKFKDLISRLDREDEDDPGA